MAQVTITLESNAEFNIVRIDDKKILRSPGSQTVDLPEGSHVMTWQIKGQQGEKYNLSVSHPAWSKSVTLDRFGLDFGFHTIQL